MRFAREGYPFIGAALVLAALGWVGWATGFAGLAGQVLASVLTVLALFVLWFFRDPERRIPTEAGVVVAPGEGRVIVVEESEEPTYVRGGCRKVSIFLSVFDIHVQRAPCAGTVEHRVYKPGTYAVAWLDKASDDNEQASLGLATPHGKVLVRQIAGLIARRIVTYPVEGQAVARGERIGLIRFGSRVDLFFPLDWEVTCAVGDRAVAGLTVLARQPGAAP
ncbi:MAG: phosphatidylserine decarboxylase proenzyme [Gemmatimonadota bacterium]